MKDETVGKPGVKKGQKLMGRRKALKVITAAIDSVCARFQRTRSEKKLLRWVKAHCDKRLAELKKPKLTPEDAAKLKKQLQALENKQAALKKLLAKAK